MVFLNKFKKNVFSQNGEDGILLKVINDLNLDKNSLTVCECGAWDGKYLSNTFNLIEKYNAYALLIESDIFKYNQLLDTSKKYKSIIPVNKTVSISGENSLDSILKTHNFKKDFDVLSIDIDSYDLFIWKTYNYLIQRL